MTGLTVLCRPVSPAAQSLRSLRFFFAFILFSLFALPASAQVDVLTQHNDNARTGQNLNETILTPVSVSGGKFGKLFTQPLDGHVFAQPLVAAGLTIAGRVRNVLYVATEHNSVYALDADDGTFSPLWRVSLGTPVSVPNNYFGNRYGPYHDVPLEIGITGTPVIDKSTSTLYVVAFTQDSLTGPYHMILYALDLITGAPKFGSPVNITGSVAGTGGGSSGGRLPFDPEQHLQRPGLALANGTLYIAFGSHADTDPYHGWVFSYNATTLAQTGIFCATPNSNEAGIWMAGAGLAVDSAGSVYFETGNGDFTASAGGRDYGEAFVRLTSSGTALSVADYFTPYNVTSLNNGDTDLGSGGLTLLPDQPGLTPHLLVGAGKEGKIYLVNRDAGKMGGFNSAFDNVTQSIGGAIAGTWSKPAYFNGAVYYAGNGDNLKAFPLTSAAGSVSRLAATASSRSATAFAYPGATPVISASGASGAVVWAIESASSGYAVLHAYDASNLAYELYNSAKAASSRDNAGYYDKFTTPTVANGKVYVPAQFQISVYGLGNFLDTPVFTPPSATFSASQTVSIAVTTPGATLHYTTDGTLPTASSPTYNGPITLTSSATVQALAVAPGYANSSVASGYYLKGDAPGDGNGLQGAYFPNTTLTAPASVTKIDPTVNFLWNGGAPTSGVSATNFSVRWSGLLLPRSTGTYTFTTVSDDGIRLWVNGQQIINNWTGHGATADSGSITLTQGTAATIQMEYYQGAGGSQIQLFYAAAGLPMQIVPQSQLYFGTSPTVSAPVISPQSSSFYPSATVSISDATTGATIYYTTDGTTPTTASPVYTAPFNVAFTTTVKAFAAKANRAASAVVSSTLTYNPNLALSHISINSGGPAVAPFVGDTSFSSGAGHTRVGAVDTSMVPNPAPEAVYQAERIGGFNYVFLNLTPGALYTVRLHFAENTATATGQRIMNVLINSKPALSNFDIYAEAGGPFKAIVREFTVPANNGGVILIGFATVTGAAKLSGLELLPAMPTMTVSGTALLESLAVTAAKQTLRFQFRPVDGSAPFTLTAPVGADGAFSLPNIPAVSYNLAIDGDKWLQKVTPLDLTTDAPTMPSVTLLAGDANGDNTVDSSDFGLLIGAFNSAANLPGSGYDLRADFNADGLVDSSDFSLLIGNYGVTGDR